MSNNIHLIPLLRLIKNHGPPVLAFGPLGPQKLRANLNAYIYIWPKTKNNSNTSS